MKKAWKQTSGSLSPFQKVYEGVEIPFNIPADEELVDPGVADETQVVPGSGKGNGPMGEDVAKALLEDELHPLIEAYPHHRVHEGMPDHLPPGHRADPGVLPRGATAEEDQARPDRLPDEAVGEAGDVDAHLGLELHPLFEEDVPGVDPFRQVVGMHPYLDGKGEEPAVPPDQGGVLGDESDAGIGMLKYGDGQG